MPAALTPRDLKIDMRRVVRAAVRDLSRFEREREQALCETYFPKLPGYAQARVVCLYVSVFAEELDTRPLLDRALADGKELVCPRVDREARLLRLARVADLKRDLEPGMMGIPEPRSDLEVIDPRLVDWLLAPGLAFDREFYRLGRGGGYYDRLLPLLRADALRWALCFDCQRVVQVPREAHDQPVDGVGSASGLLARRSGSSGPPASPGAPEVRA